MYFLDAEGGEYKETIKNAGRKLEVTMEAAMPCETGTKKCTMWECVRPILASSPHSRISQCLFCSSTSASLVTVQCAHLTTLPTCTRGSRTESLTKCSHPHVHSCIITMMSPVILPIPASRKLKRRLVSPTNVQNKPSMYRGGA